MSKRCNTRRRNSDHPRLTCTQLEELCSQIEDGLSLKQARRELGVKNQQIESALAELDALFIWSMRVKLILGDELEAVLYRKAMNGNVPAQIEYLERYRQRKSDEDEII